MDAELAPDAPMVDLSDLQKYEQSKQALNVKTKEILESVGFLLRDFERLQAAGRDLGLADIDTLSDMLRLNLGLEEEGQMLDAAPARLSKDALIFFSEISNSILPTIKANQELVGNLQLALDLLPPNASQAPVWSCLEQTLAVTRLFASREESILDPVPHDISTFSNTLAPKPGRAQPSAPRKRGKVADPKRNKSFVVGDDLSSADSSSDGDDDFEVEESVRHPAKVSRPAAGISHAQPQVRMRTRVSTRSFAESSLGRHQDGDGDQRMAVDAASSEDDTDEYVDE